MSRLKEGNVQEDPSTEASAARARERLVAFAGEMAGGLAHPRQRENALIYVRGLIEHGGREEPAAHAAAPRRGRRVL